MPHIVLSLSAFLRGAGVWPMIGLIVLGIIVLVLLSGRGAAPKPRAERGVRRNIRTAGSAKLPDQENERSNQ